MSEAREPDDGRFSGRSWLMLALLCVAQFMLIINVTAVNVMIPSIRDDLGIADSRLQLVSVAYTLTFGSLLIVFGRMGDSLGRRRVLLVGLTVFTAASLASGLAQNEWVLFLCRAAQGVGAAMVSSTALALLVSSFREGPARNRALGYWGAVGAAGAIVGQLIGGFITVVFGWRWTFLINVPIGVVAVILIRIYIAENRAKDRSSLDLPGAILLTVGLAAGIFALTEFGQGGQTLIGVLLVIAAVLLLGVLVLVERRQKEPLIDARVLRTGHVAGANILLAVNAGMIAAALYFTTLYLQVVLGLSPLVTGLGFAPVTLVILLLSPRAGALTTRYGVRRLLFIGFVLISAGMLLLSRFPVGGNYFLDVLPGLMLVGIGSALCYAPLFISGTNGVSENRQGLASGLLNSSQELGPAIGVSAIGAIAVASAFGGDPESLTTGYRIGLLVAGAAMALSLLLVSRMPGRPKAVLPERE